MLEKAILLLIFARPIPFGIHARFLSSHYYFFLQVHHLWSKSGFSSTTGIVCDKVCTPESGDKVCTPGEPKTKSCPRLRSRLGLIPNDSNSLDWIYVLIKLSLLLIDTHYGACMWYWILMHYRLSRLKYERIQSMSECKIPVLKKAGLAKDLDMK